MEVFIKIAQFVLSLSILVILHEFGHFVFAKLFKTRVEKFYLFFNPWFSVFKFNFKGTEYGMGWLPLGGYVKISGMIDESMDKEQMKKPAEPWEFRSKPAWQRLLIMLGGVMVNFILALVIYAMVLFVWGEEYLANEDVKYGIICNDLGHELGLMNGDKIISVEDDVVKDFYKIFPEIVLNSAKYLKVERNNQIIEVPINEDIIPQLIKSKGLFEARVPYYVGEFSETSAAKVAGIQVEDRIYKINGVETPFYDVVVEQLSKYKNQEIVVSVLRNGQELDYPIEMDSTSTLGVYAIGTLTKFFDLTKVEYGFIEAIPAGIKKGTNMVQSYLKQLKLLFAPKNKAYESLGGFITIGSIFPSVWDWQSFWSMTAFLSIVLAIMNVLPIPALDGGHVTFLIYEIVTGRKPSDKFLEYAQIAGMLILLALLIFANTNDIIKVIQNKF